MTAKFATSYLPEFFALLLGRSKPGMVTINLTDRCNQHCIYCEIGKNNPSLTHCALSVEDLTWIIDQMAEYKIRKISLCGGEPFLFDGIIDVVAYAGNKNIHTSITTNGMSVHLLSESELNILKTSKTEINISIDSFDNNIQSYTRGASSALPMALKSIRKLNDKKIPVTILTVISRYNFHHLYEFLLEAWKMGIKQVLFQPVICYSNYPDRQAVAEKQSLNVSPGDIDRLMEELKKIHNFERTHRIKTNVYRILPWIEHYLRSAAGKNGKWFFNEVLKKFYCREIYAIIDIAYDGGLQPCGLALANTTIHENRHQGLIRLWADATARIRNDLENERYHPYCNGCCHHFSRNMLASIMKYPISNFSLLMNMSLSLLQRFVFWIFKRILIQ